MRKLIPGLIAGFVATTSLHAQTLFTYGGLPVSKQEFLRVYEKNSLNKKTDLSEPALREYLDLYSLFRMKVHEAELMHLDTMTSLSSELDNYRRQLARNYLTDKEVTGRLVHEAYDRMTEEVHVAHILVMCSITAPPADTFKAWHKVDSLRKMILAGKVDFATAAKDNSEDRGSRENGGDIGYLTALQTLYPFENAAYSTPVGKVSGIFRTQFGYHILKVLDKRLARGEIQVAQILISASKSKGDAGLTAAKLRADSVEMMLRNGASFDDMVVKYSEDKFTNTDKGVMAPFGVGRMAPSFENAAFALKNPGDISKPVQTDYGYHIIRLISKMPLKPFDSLQESIKRRVDNDSRAQVAHDIYFDKVKKQHGYKEYPQHVDEVASALSHIVDTGKNANAFRAEDYGNMRKPVFDLGGTAYTQSDFISFAAQLTRGHLNGPKAPVVHDIFRLYVDRTVNDYEEHHLAEQNPDFKNLMEEYRNGIMLFELMDRNVWGKATRDSAGLKTFYAQHNSRYQWAPGFSGVIYHFRNQQALDEGMKALNKDPNVKDETLVKAINSESMPEGVTMQRGHYEFDHFKDADRSVLVKGKLTAPVKDSTGSFTVIKVDEVYNVPTTKTLDESRGYAVAEYQDYLEKQWNEELRRKYPLNVDQAVFKSMVK